ncbi:MAG: SdrD B-like domain-containing protein [Chloroflexota bacterium]
MFQNKPLRKLLVLAGVLTVIALALTACGPQQAAADPKQDLAIEQLQPESATPGPSVVLNDLAGEVLSRQADQEFSEAEDGYLLYLNGQVQTGSNGRARLDFEDGTIVRIGPSSLFTLEEIEETEDGTLKQLFLEFGQVWVVLVGGELEVDTPAGVASVRGSYLSVWQDPVTGETYATCAEGDCVMFSGGVEIHFTAGETALVTGPGEIPLPGVMSLEEFKLWWEINPELLLIMDLIPGSLDGWAWSDKDGNGLQDDGEPGLAGVEVALFDLTEEQIAVTETDEDGYYQFEDLLVGQYSLQFSQPVGFVFTLPDEGADDSIDSDPDAAGLVSGVNIIPGDNNTPMDAGFVRPGGGAVCPLTGLPIDDQALLDLRPLFISISIFPEAVRPVTGINSAPVVFETLIDEGQTRLQALFYCGYPEALPNDDGGSSASGGFDISGVRSGRVFYAELAQLFGAGLIFGGASPEVFPTIAPFTCSLADSANKSDIGGVGLNVDNLVGIAESCQSNLGNTDLAVWDFGDPPEGGEPVEKFLMHYNYMNQSRWIYEPEAGGYVRYQNTPSEPEEFVLATDRLTGDAVVRQNILLLKVSHQVMNSSGTIINFDLTNERGFAVLLRNGTAHNVCWSAVFDDYPEMLNRYRPFLVYNCETKEPVNLEFGSMWVNVVDYSVGFSWQGEYWRAYQPYLNYMP